jgi:hypothetical protein
VTSGTLSFELRGCLFQLLELVEGEILAAEHRVVAEPTRALVVENRLIKLDFLVKGI